MEEPPSISTLHKKTDISHSTTTSKSTYEGLYGPLTGLYCAVHLPPVTMDFDNPNTPEIPLPLVPLGIVSYELVPGDSSGSEPYILAMDQGGSLWLCFHLRGTRRSDFPSSPHNWQRLN